jgi:hypothetical protein
MPETTNIQHVSLIIWNPFRTTNSINNFRLWKEYLYRPSHDPDALISPKDSYRPHISAVIPDSELDGPGIEESSPYSNKAVGLVMGWQNSGSPAKTDEEVNSLVHSILLHPDFDLTMLGSFNAMCENQKADAVLLQPFQRTDVKIKVPSGSKLVAPQILSIPSLYYRNIIGLIKETFESPVSLKFHLTPFKLFRQHPNHDEHIYSEMYDSDIFLEEHDKVQHVQVCSPRVLASTRRLWLPLCSGRMLPILQHLALQSYGLSTCCSEISQNIFDANPVLVQSSTWLTSLHSLTCFMTN